MSGDNDSEVFTLLQPELLTPDQLISYLKSSESQDYQHGEAFIRSKQRCSNMHNLSLLSKERLVSLFRQVVLPLPQRQCWANRRGKVLTARRLKSSPEGRQDNTSPRPGNTTGLKRDRLKPAPDTNTPNKIRITTSDASRGSDLDKIVINDRSRHSNESLSPGAVQVKRSSSNMEKFSGSSGEPIKKQKTAIRWP